MSRWILTLVMAALVCFGASALSLAQEDDPAGAQPTDEQPEDTPVQPADDQDDEEGEPGEQKVVAALVDDWQGEVQLKKSGEEDFEVFAPVGEEKATVNFGDTFRTGEGATVKFTLPDGTIIELGPNSELIFEQTPEGTAVARLISGSADVEIGSENFAFVCLQYTVTGEGSRVQVAIEDENTVTFFAVEGGAEVQNEYGLVMRLDQGQKIESSYSEESGLYTVTVHEFNELPVEIEANGETTLIEPGASFTFDAEGNIEMVVEEQPPPEPITVIPPELEEPEDEPYENAGDLGTIHVVSPKKP